MPKPLGQQPDDKPVHEQVQELIRKAHTDRMAPVGIVFSQTGYDKAMLQTVPGLDPWLRTRIMAAPTHYLGLPFTISNSLTTGDVLLDLVPGGSAEAKAFRDGQRTMRADHDHPVPYRDGLAVRFRVDHLDPHQTTMELAGQALTVPQLSDLIIAWCDANPSERMVDALRDTVAKYGRFE